VEADLRSPSFVNALNLMPDPDASIEPLRYYSSGSGCIHLAPGIENLYIVPSPGPQRQAAAILESSELRQFLEDARGRFDFVVIDTPALSRCNDALLLEPLSDGMVLVTRPSYTQESMLTEAIDELIEAELPLLGAIINGVDKPIPIVHTEEIEIQERADETQLLERKELDRENSIPTEAIKF
jgi:Mrp family chromosome partitioning ATPase